MLLVTIDTLRADHVESYGGPVPTPAFARLAAEGVLLENAFTPTPTTGPAHASLLTGQHPWRHGVLENAVPLGPDPVTAAERFSDAGFATAAFVSSYVLHPRFAMGRGFEHYEFVATEPGRWQDGAHERFFARGETTVAKVVAWLDGWRRTDDRRLFLWVHLFDPHDPYTPPAAFLPPADAPISLEGRVPGPAMNAARLRQLMRAYRGEVRYVDAQLGHLLDAFATRGLLDETAVIVTADHGEGFGEHGTFGHGGTLYDELVRVPLIVCAPGLPAGRRLAGPAQLEDLYPTALALAGLPRPPDVDGFDLRPWLRGEAPHSPRAAVMGERRHFAGRPRLLFHWTPQRKWIGTPDGTGTAFDPRSDPFERNGRRTAAPEGFADVARAGAPRERELDDAAREALGALGYLDDAADATAGIPAPDAGTAP